MVAECIMMSRHTDSRLVNHQVVFVSYGRRLALITIIYMVFCVLSLFGVVLHGLLRPIYAVVEACSR